jgi:SnoaL-like domain
VTDTERIARRYFDAWTSRDGATVAALLAPDFRFTAGEMRIEGRDAFLSGGAFPADAATRMVAEAYQDDRAFQMYDAARGERTVRIVEHLVVRDGLIASSEIVTDPAAFAAFAGAA